MKKSIIFSLAVLIITGFFTACSKINTDEKTIANLKSSLSYNIYAANMYDAFAEKASEEGYQQIAKLFKAMSLAEGVHAKNIKDVLESARIQTEKHVTHLLVESTEKNLQKAIQEEIMNIDIFYPRYIRQSINSGVDQANHIFSTVWEAEKTYKNILVLFYDQLMTKVVKTNRASIASAPQKENLSKIEDLFSKSDYYVCPADGRVLNNHDVTRACALCHISKSNFLAIN